MNKFKELGLGDSLLKTIERENFTEPTEIQRKSIPLILDGKDVVAGSATGSGKTLAFGAGIIERCNPGQGLQAIVLTPTRELAEQVGQALKKFSKVKKLKMTIVYGGVSISPQIRELRSADVLIGTPGRIMDHMERRTVNLQKIKIFVLDEADRMVDMGFIDDVKKIMKQCPRERQTLLFSATITPETKKIAKVYMNDSVEIKAENYVDPKKLKQVYYDVPDNIKFSLLVHLLKQEHAGLAMIFCNSRMNVEFVANNLERQGIEAVAMHGGFSQDKRTKVMKRFNAKNVFALVCTDVAARGLDIKGVSHVYNYDIPKDPKQYVHRIGRTARAGKEGIAINLLSGNDHDNYSKVLRENDVTIKKAERPQVERIEIVRNNRGGNRGNFQNRPQRGFRGNGSRSNGGPRRGNGGARRSQGSSRGESGPRRSNNSPRRSQGSSRGEGSPRRSEGGSRFKKRGNKPRNF